MRWSWLVPVLSIASILAAPVMTARAETAPETLRLEAEHTSATFTYQHFGLSRPSGKVMGASGTVILDREQPQNSSVEASFDLNTLVTGLPMFDGTMKSEDYFNVERFPRATFKSRAVRLTGEKTAEIDGDLTIRGVTKPVTLAVTFNARAFNPALFKTGVGFTARTTIKRSDFGMTKLLTFIGDEVDLVIEAEAY